jgi:asparagine synthase (glutamine-hydrolysing)
MCRIAGIINHQLPPNESIITAMRDSMLHGGPDDAGLYLDAERNLAFGHRRLSLIDLSSLGHQPMIDVQDNIVLIFNGEIYNFQNIKILLQANGYQFKSSSDTEVIIYAYLEWGYECFAKFNGMFALALLDKRTNKILLARDHAGIKPLYYSINQNSLHFASEIKAFKIVNPNWKEAPEWKKYFLLFGHLPEPITTLHNVFALPKGNLLEIDCTTLKHKFIQFYKNYYHYQIYSENEAIDKIKTTLTDAVQSHLISDAPIGLFLSGGIDSSLLTILAKPFINENLRTLSIVFDDDKFSEKSFQDIIIRQTGAQHHSFLVTESEFNDSLTDIIAAMDQPSYDGINSYFISKYAKQYGLKAVLSGLGADELFGGYPSFKRDATLSLLQKIPAFILRVTDLSPTDKKRRLSFLYLKNMMGDYLLQRGVFVPKQIAAILDCSEKEIDTFIQQINVPLFIKKIHPLEKVSYYETNWYMQNQLLKDTDFMSMWHGVEVRVPFLDKELMQLIYSIHPSVRFSIYQSKHLLIKAFKNELPEPIWNRPKQGFTFPFEKWMKHLQVNKPNNISVQFQEDLRNNKIHWSKYWCYLLATQIPLAVSE